MVAAANPGIRRSIFDIQEDYDTGKDRRPLELLMRAWKGIKELPPEDPNSFFMLGGYHGEPFRGPGIADPNWWGGYCQHGTVLFPTWHRAYLHRMEKALQSVPGCESVMLPFWDECSAQSQNEGIPKALTDPTFVLDGQTIPNPLRSFVFPEGIVDRVTGATDVYSKPAGYETVRYPLSGLVGTPADAAATEAHNQPYIADPGSAVSALNGNIKNWLTGKIEIDGKASEPEIYRKFVDCLDAPTYTLFSNVTSAGAWNETHKAHLVPLESPHNDMHLAVGGFDYPNQGDFSPIAGANGDMGENDTAGLDPIFYFHHCFIDYVFWTWQKRHSATDTFTIDPHDPGAAYWASANASNQPPAGANYGDVLGLDTPLDPFPKPDGTGKITTADCINIERQLGYTYGPGSLDAHAQPPIAAMAISAQPAPPGHTVRVSGVNRTHIRGSFLISAFATVDGKREYIGTRAVLSRWHLEGCMNCQSHLETKAHFRLPARADAVRAGATGALRAVTAPPQVEVEIHTHDGLFGGGPQRPIQASLRSVAAQTAPFKVEIL